MPTFTAPARERGTGSFVGPADENDLQAVREAAEVSPFIELGSTGLKRAGGYVDEEFLPELRGRKAVQVYREMGDNDPTVGAMLFALVYLMSETNWSVDPAGRTRDDANAARLLETCMEDMSHSWSEFVAEALTSLQYGWSWHEIVLKRRCGPWQRDSKLRSKFSDGLVGWKKLPIRGQESMQRWAFDDNGDVAGMIQMAPPDYQIRNLPLNPRGLLFRTGVHKGNPEGRSILRNVYRPWFYKKRMEEHESIGVERDLAGLPMVSLPASYLRARQGTDQAKMVDAMKRMVRSVRRNEQEGIVFPTDYDEDTRQPMFKMELLGSGGARQFSTNEIIARYKQDMLMTCLLDFLLVGHEETGTYNMHADKRGIFNTALNTVIRRVADVMNRHAVPRLFMANGWRPAQLPKFRVADVDSPDLNQLSAFLTATAGIGFPWGPDADIEKYLRDAAGLPDLSRPDFDRHRLLARRTEATRMAETQTAYLAARSQLAQATAAAEQLRTGEPTPEHAGAIAGAQQQQADSQQAGQQQQADQAQAQTDDQRAGEQHDAAMATSRMDLMERWQAQLSTPAAGKKKT